MSLPAKPSSSDKSDEQISWKEVFWSGPGPVTFKQAFILFIKGICIGGANIIPGVSGGTIALITGIYQELLDSIRSFNFESLRLLSRFQVKRFFSAIHLRFLFVLISGVAVSILTLAHFMNYLFNSYPVYVWSLFLGLILASIFIMISHTKNWLGAGGASFLAGTILSYIMVRAIPVSTPESWWFILLVGAGAICTMLLPGLSGAFLLLILGKYEYITRALKQPWLPDNLVVILIFSAGCLIGVITFSRLLSFMLERHYSSTMALLTGVMCGSMRKLWPWKETLETQIIRGKVYIISEQNILPPQYDQSFLIAAALMLLGGALVLILERTARS